MTEFKTQTAHNKLAPCFLFSFYELANMPESQLDAEFLSDNLLKRKPTLYNKGM